MKRYLAWLLPLVVCLSGCTQNQPSALEQATREEKAVNVIQKLGGLVTRDDKLPGRPVVAVRLGLPAHASGVLAHGVLDALKEFKALQTLSLSGGCYPARQLRLTDDGLKQVVELRGLRALSLSGTKVTDAGLASL